MRVVVLLVLPLSSSCLFAVHAIDLYYSHTIGLREVESLHLESRQLSFPRDYPECLHSFSAYWEERKKQLIAKYDAKPPSKRVRQLSTDRPASHVVRSDSLLMFLSVYLICCSVQVNYFKINRFHPFCCPFPTLFQKRRIDPTCALLQTVPLRIVHDRRRIVELLETKHCEEEEDTLLLVRVIIRAESRGVPKERAWICDMHDHSQCPFLLSHSCDAKQPKNREGDHEKEKRGSDRRSRRLDVAESKCKLKKGNDCDEAKTGRVQCSEPLLSHVPRQKIRKQKTPKPKRGESEGMPDKQQYEKANVKQKEETEEKKQFSTVIEEWSVNGDHRPLHSPIGFVTSGAASFSAGRGNNRSAYEDMCDALRVCVHVSFAVQLR